MDRLYEIHSCQGADSGVECRLRRGRQGSIQSGLKEVTQTRMFEVRLMLGLESGVACRLRSARQRRWQQS